MKTSIFLFIVLIGLGSCNRLKNTEAKTIATINDLPVLVEEFRDLFTQLKNQYDEISQKNPKVIEQLKSRALNESIILALLREEAKKHNIQIAKEEVEGRLANWKDGYPPGGFEEMLSKRNTTERYLKKRIENLLLIEKLTNELFASETLVSDEEMKEHFKKHKKKFYRPLRVHALQILVPTQEEAIKIRQEIASNRLTFESAARKYSLSPDAAKGGDLGFFAKNEKIPAFNSAFSLKVGNISKPIKSPYGFHLLKVVEKQVRKKLKYSEASPKVSKEIKRNKEMNIYKEWVTKLLKEGKIYRNDTLFASIT